MLNGQVVILGLKIAVGAATLILLASLLALARSNFRLHGRLNLIFFILTFAAVFGLELLFRVVDPTLFGYFDEPTQRALRIHLSFSIPSTFLIPAMYITGRTGRRRVHLTLAALFGIAWTGTVVTGIFFLPHN